MIYQDGVPRVVGVWDHPLMDVLAVDHAERIAVYKGPQPAFNSGTFGSVEIFSKRRYTPGTETETEVSIGEHDTLTGRLHYGGRTERGFDYYGGISRRETDGHRPHSQAQLQSLYGRIGSRLNNTLSLSSQVTVTDNWVNDPGRIDEPTPQRDRFATRTVTSSIRLDNRSDALGGYVLIYHEDGQIRWDKDFINGPDTPPGSSNTDWENYGFRIGQTAIFDRLNLHAALEGISEGGSTENVTITGAIPFAYDDRYETLIPGLAIDTIFSPTGNWQFQPSAGLRAYFHSDFKHTYAPQAGLRARNRNWTFFTSAARGVNYPGVYASGIAASTRNRLKAETLAHTEAGFQWQRLDRAFQAGLSVFRDETDNLLQWTPEGLINTGSADINGLELSTSLSPTDTLALYASVTLMDPADARTPRAPDWTISAGASLALAPNLKLHADLDAVASQYAFNGRAGAMERTRVEKIERYTIGNVRVSYRPERGKDLGLTLFAGCSNIADESYETQAGYPLPGRFYNGGARLAF